MRKERKRGKRKKLLGKGSPVSRAVVAALRSELIESAGAAVTMSGLKIA